MKRNDLIQGFLFGVRVGNAINGNTVDIEWNKIVTSISDIASGRITIQSTGAELQAELPGITNTEHLVRDNIACDQSLAKLILDHLRMQDPRIDRDNTSS